MEVLPTSIPCEAKFCVHYEDYLEGCVYIDIELDSTARCKSYKIGKRCKPYKIGKRKKTASNNKLLSKLDIIKEYTKCYII